MFDRFIRLAKARKALQEKRFEDALQLADDPLIRATRRAEDVRDCARGKLLGRARQRLADADLRAARGLFQRLESLADNAAVQQFGRELEIAEGRARELAEAARQGVDDARKLIAKGRVAAAAAAVAGLPDGGLPAERQQLEHQLADRQRRANEQLELVVEHLDSDRIGEARQAFARAAALDRDAAREAGVRERLFEAVARDVGARIVEFVAAGDLVAALGELRRGRAEADDAASHEAFDGALRKPLAKLESALSATIQQLDDVGAATALAEAAHQAEFEPSGPVAELLAALRASNPQSGPGDPAAVEQLEGAARRAGAKQLAAAARQRAARHGDIEALLSKAKAATDAADLDAARERLTQVLAEDPMHDVARRELELVEQGITELAGRLEAARAAARVGKLREACASALAIGTSGRLGAEAQLLLTDVRARMALVDRGLDEVRATLHGKAAGSLQGVRHCLARLEELQKVQVDHEDLTRVIAAVGAEIEGLEACDRVAVALDAGDIADAAQALDSVLDRRDRLLAVERLDARVLTLADRLQKSGERALAGGNGRDVDVCAGVLERLAAVSPEFGNSASRLRQEAAEKLTAADERAEQARACLQERDFAAAERLLEEARELWAEAPAVRALAEQLRDYRRQSDAITEVAELARGRDYRGAAEKVAAMPPTPALLRTRIFDMKQQLARAQGLEGAFLMRVDEGGEHLVLRGESISIGNVRQNCADLPVLANVAGKHATIERSMSFHGGMEDRIVADGGEVRVGGRVVREHRLAPGDRIQFGSSLAAVYQRPTKRSLSVGLVLQGGFQVAGTERVLLMKDRGKDGRILLGPSRDVHVQVGGASHEVEVFAASTGQVRVACAAGGTIDGNPFKGEHPVDAGQVVEAGGITFVLLPWRPN